MNGTVNYVALGLALIQGLANLIVWAREKELISAGEQQAMAAALRKQADDMDKVHASDADVDAARAAGKLRPLEDRWTRD